MFKKIKKIQNMAVFNDFDWDREVKELNGRVAELKTVNIIYGRNYSGKTTLSRVLRSFETGVISDKYQTPSYELEFYDGAVITNTDIPYMESKVRVFNEDFVRDNLKFIINSDENISSFAVLGDDNNRIEEEISLKEVELGSEEDGTGKLAIKKQKTITFQTANNNLRAAEGSLESKITDKANKKGSGIKHNKVFGEATYNSPKLKKDIITALAEDFVPAVIPAQVIFFLFKKTIFF